MTFVATILVGADQTHSLKDLTAKAHAALTRAGVSPEPPEQLGETAQDIPFTAGTVEEARAALADALSGAPADLFVQRAETRGKRLFFADMDSTMITVECIDEIADMLGIKDQVARITEAAMQGELDFEGALVERVALLKGLDEAALDQVYRERIVFSPGARTLVRTLARRGTPSVLVSGGFTFFTERVADALSFTDHHANRLEIADGKLTGKVLPPIFGPNAKLETLESVMASHNIAAERVVAVGDGANDIPMLTRAGLGVAYHAKPKAQAAADVALNHADLTGILYILGYTQDEFVG